MSSCSLCRVPLTDEHVQTAWHIYNVRVTDEEGKTPLTLELFEQFEKPRLNGDGKVKDVPDHLRTKNVRSWHWEEEDLTTWAKERLQEIILETKIPVHSGSLSITKITKCEGDATVRNRRGKKFVGFEFQLDMKWNGKIEDDEGNVIVSVDGSCSMPDICSEDGHDDYEVLNITCEGKDKGEKAMVTVFKNSGVAMLRKQCGLFVNELRKAADAE